MRFKKFNFKAIFRNIIQQNDNDLEITEFTDLFCFKSPSSEVIASACSETKAGFEQHKPTRLERHVSSVSRSSMNKQ